MLPPSQPQSLCSAASVAWELVLTVKTSSPISFCRSGMVARARTPRPAGRCRLLENCAIHARWRRRSLSGWRRASGGTSVWSISSFTSQSTAPRDFASDIRHQAGAKPVVLVGQLGKNRPACTMTDFGLRWGVAGNSVGLLDTDSQCVDVFLMFPGFQQSEARKSADDATRTAQLQAMQLAVLMGVKFTESREDRVSRPWDGERGPQHLNNIHPRGDIMALADTGGPRVCDVIKPARGAGTTRAEHRPISSARPGTAPRHGTRHHPPWPPYPGMADASRDRCGQAGAVVTRHDGSLTLPRGATEWE